MGRILIDDRKVHAVASDAEEAFWREVAKAFPHVKSGDLAPESDMPFRRACRDVIRAWVEENTPDELVEWAVHYTYTDAKPNEVHRATGYVRATDESEAREIVAKACARSIRIDEVSRVPDPPKRWKLDVVANDKAGTFRFTRWIDAATSEDAEKILRSEAAGFRTIEQIKSIVEDPTGSTAVVELPSKPLPDPPIVPEHDKGPGHTEALNEDWSAFVEMLPEHNGWKATWEYPGFVLWAHPKLQLALVATPDWDSGDNEEIVFDLQDNAGERLKAFGPEEWFAKEWSVGDINPWPKDERTVASYMAIVGPKIDGIMGVIAEYRNAAIRHLQDAGWDGTGEDGDISVDDVPDFCPIAEEVPGAWVVVSIFIDQRDLTGEPVVSKENK